MKAKNYILLLFLCLGCINLHAKTYYVRSSGGLDTNDGLSPETAFATLNQAFTNTALLNNDIIDISGTFTHSNTQKPIKSVTIQGNDKTKAIINGVAGASNRCFTVTSGLNIVIENVTLQNYDNYSESVASTGGVFIVNPGASLTCRNVNFLNNRSSTGGALSIGGGTVIFEDCYFYNNQAKLYSTTTAYGGAINVSSTSSSDFDITINRCLFENNSTDYVGAAIRFRGNTPGNPNLLIMNSTFVNNVSNHSTVASGAIYLEGTSTTAYVKLINNTIAYNRILSTNAARCAGVTAFGMNDCISLANNIFFSNLNAAESPKSVSIVCGSSVKFQESRNNIIDNNFDFVTLTNNEAYSDNINNVTAEQLLISSALVDQGGATKVLPITNKSVAKDAGYVILAPNVDQRNTPRDGSPDVGAYENTGYTAIDIVPNANLIYFQSGKNILIKNTDDYKNMQLYTLSGKFIINKLCSGKYVEFDSLNSGIYFLKLINSKSSTCVKLIVK